MTADSRWTRRDFLSTTALGIIGMGIGGSSVGADERFAYIGTYTNTGHSDGIYRLFLNTTTGAMRVDGVAAAIEHPAVNNKFPYAPAVAIGAALVALGL